jgi:hypothetical protein
MPDNLLSLSKLPADIQAKLVELQSPAANRFVFLKKSSILNYVAIAVCIGWLAYLFIATSDYLWADWMFWLFAVLTLIVVPLGVWSAWTIIAAFTGRTKHGYVFTPDECISYKGDRIGFRGLGELESFQYLEPIKTIEIWIGETVEKIKAEGPDDPLKLDEVFNDWQKEAGEPFLRPHVTAETAFNPMPARAVSVAFILASLLISLGVSFAAKRINRGYDDEQTWKRTENSKTVADFNAYKERHPSGDHAADADQRIVDIIKRAKEDYSKNLKPNANQTAVAALSGLLDEMVAGPDRRVYVKFTEDRQLDEEVVRKLKLQTGLSISSYDFTIPTTALQYRKDKILNDISVMFLPATRNASVEFVLSDDPPPDAPVINVRSVMKSIEMYYFYNWYSASGTVTTFYNPGARFEIDFELRPRDASKVFKTQYVSNFTRGLKTGAIDTRDAANYSFDKLFFGSVSEDLAKFLQREFGFVE